MSELRFDLIATAPSGEVLEEVRNLTLDEVKVHVLYGEYPKLADVVERENAFTAALERGDVGVMEEDCPEGTTKTLMEIFGLPTAITITGTPVEV